MSDVNRQTTKPGLRTFARDLEAVRQARGLVQKTEPVTAAVVPPPPRVHAGTIPSRPVTPTITTASPKEIPTPITTTPIVPLENEPIKITATSDRDASYEATIITDNKHKRFRLGTALTEAVTGWFKSTTAPKKDKKPAYTVPPVERRKGVVEQAATMTARGATQDHHEIVARLRAERSGGLPTVTPVPPTPTPTIEPRPSTPPPGPTFAVLEKPKLVPPLAPADMDSTPVPPVIEKPIPTTDTQSTKPSELPALVITEPEPLPPPPKILPIIPEFPPEPIQREISVPYEEIKEATNEFYEGVLTDDTDQSEDFDSDQQEDIFVAEPPLEVPDVAQTPEPPETPQSPTPISFPKITPVVPGVDSPVTTESAVATLPVELPTESPRRPVSKRGALEARKAALAEEAKANPKPTRQTNRLSLWLPIGLVSLVVFATIGTVAYIFLGASPTIENPTTLTPTTPGLPPLIGNTGADSPLIQAAVLESNTRFSLYTALATAKDATLATQFITPLQSETNTPFTTRELLQVINRQLVADFVAVVSDVRVGYQNGAPTIVLRVSDMTIARGGMFVWERTLATDLGPWFPSGTNTRTSVYTDTTIADIDVRRLADSTGKTVLVYGMKNNTVIITSDEAAFAELASLYIPQW